MKALKYVLVFVAALIVFVVAAMFLGYLPKPAFLQKGITGEAILQVKVVMDNKAQDPVANVEVDVAKKPGPPPEGGVSATDQTGLATFHIQPGEYMVFFNQTNFPKNLAMPEAKPVTVTLESPNQLTIVVDTAN